MLQQSRPGKQASAGRTISCFASSTFFTGFTRQDAISGVGYWSVLTHDGNWYPCPYLDPLHLSYFLHFLLKKARERAAGWTSSRQTRSTHPIFSVFFPRNLLLRSEGAIKESQFQERLTAWFFSPPSQLNFINFNNLLMKNCNFIVEIIYLTVLVVEVVLLLTFTNNN